jgi:hypothetical protein
MSLLRLGRPSIALAQQMAAHELPQTTALYDRRDDEVAVDEVESFRDTRSATS